MFCAEHSAVNHQPDRSVANELRCKCWACDHCQPINQGRLKARCINGDPDKFLTLTLSPEGFETPDAAARFMVRAFRDLRRRMVRENRRDLTKNPTPWVDADWRADCYDARGRVRRLVRLYQGNLPFLAVLEAHKSGWPHMHVVARAGWIDRQWLRAAWADLTGSHHATIQEPRNRRQMASYIGKYLGKAPHKFEGCRRFWMSRDYEPQEAKDRAESYKLPGPWWRETKPLAALVDEFMAEGWLVEEDGRRVLLWPP